MILHCERKGRGRTDRQRERRDSIRALYREEKREGKSAARPFPGAVMNGKKEENRTVREKGLSPGFRGSLREEGRWRRKSLPV